MNTERSIKLMNVIKSILPEHYNFDFGKPEIDGVIKRLQMWEDFKEKYKGCYLMVSQSARGLNHLMNEFEQECFPKPKIRKEVRVEVLAENEDVIDELAKDIEDMDWNRKFNKGKIRIITTRWERD